MGKTNISWTDYSLNFIRWYCTKVSPGCKNCYMMALAERYPHNAADHPVWRGKNAMKELYSIPSGSRCFVGDMYDTFHEDMPIQWIHNVHNMIAYERPDVTFQLLTKRIERAVALAPYLTFPPNLWIGTSVESVDYLWRIDYLRRIPAAVRYISFEPLLASIPSANLKGIHWAIVGAESGANRRPYNLDWAIRLREICRQYGTAFFYKQGSGLYPGMNNTLNGRTYEEYPGDERIMPAAPPPIDTRPLEQLRLW